MTEETQKEGSSIGNMTNWEKDSWATKDITFFRQGNVFDEKFPNNDSVNKNNVRNNSPFEVSLMQEYPLAKVREEKLFGYVLCDL